MIRAATLDDIPAMVAMGKRFTDKAGFADHIGYDEASVEALLTGLIEGDTGVCLIGPDCMASALVFPHPYNRAHNTAQELFWWSEGLQGLRLFDALERAVKAKGAHSLIMITVEAINPDKTGQFYTRKGYRPTERSFMKVF